MSHKLVRRVAFVAVVLATGGGLASLASAQVPIERYDGVWISPDTGREFNNPTSAYLDSAGLRRRNMDLFVNQALMNQMMMDALINEQFRKLGVGVIEAGRATSAVPAWDDESVGWLLNDGLDGADREAAVKALRGDWAAYADFARSRAADPGDVADVIALATLVGFEHYRDRPTTRRQFESIRDGVRKGLLTDALYQGKGTRGAAEVAARWAFATLALNRNALDAKNANDADKQQEVREAGGVLLGGLWRSPVESIEATEDGFVDRGERVVKEGKGTTTFRRVVDDLAVARELTGGEMIQIPYDTTPLFGDPEPGADLRSYDERMTSAKEDRAKDVAAALKGFRDEAASRGLPADDLAAGGALAVAMAWPLHDDRAVPLTPPQIESAQRLFAADIVGDAGFQRMDDAARQRVFDGWAWRAISAVASAKEGVAQAQAAAASLKSDDPMERMLGLAQQGVADSQAGGTRGDADRLLADLFSPRDLEKITLTGDGFAVTP